MRFLGCVFDYGIAIGQNSGQHNVHGGADANYVKINLSAVEMAFGGPGMDKAAFDFHFCAHGGKAFDMLVNRTHAEIAAAGHGDFGPAETAQQRADHIIGSADAAGQFIGSAGWNGCARS